MYDTYFNSWAASNAYYDLEGVDFTFSTDANGVYQESMIYDSVTGTPILFHGTENGTEIYAVILDTRAETAELVSMGTIQGYQSVAMYAGSFEGEITAQAEQLLGEIEAQDQQILLTTAEEAPAQGSTNMAAGVEPTEDKSVVTVTLRADEAVGSGMAEIELGEGLTPRAWRALQRCPLTPWKTAPSALHMPITPHWRQTASSRSCGWPTTARIRR